MKPYILFPTLVLMSACISDPDDKDLQPPFIGDDEDSSPMQCGEYRRGDVIPFRCVFSDDMELGNYNIEIHGNHDHHTHSTEAEECDHHDEDHEEEAEPENPWIYNEDYPIPPGLTLYQAEFEIPVPRDIAPGDYHFMIRVTDHAGWQEIRSVSLEIE